MVPIVTRKPWGIVILVLNCIPWPGFTGVGTLMAGANQEDQRYLITGAIQTALAASFLGLIVAWPWSVVSGIRIFLRSEHVGADPEAVAAAREAKEQEKAKKAEAKEQAKADKEAAKADKATAKDGSDGD